LEQETARIQQMLDPESKVTRNEKIKDRFGHRREFDVVVRGTVGEYPILVVMECREWKKRLDVRHIEAFAAKASGVNANLAVVVAKMGFTKPALTVAKDRGIGTLNLVPKDLSERNRLSLGADWYATVWRWVKASMVLHHPTTTNVIGESAILNAACEGFRVIDWWLLQLSTSHLRHDSVGVYSTRIEFAVPIYVDIDGSSYAVIAIDFSAERRREQKTKRVEYHGEALYDWQSSVVRIPPAGTLSSQGIRTDFADWKEHIGPIPVASSFMDVRLSVYVPVVPAESTTIDLLSPRFGGRYHDSPPAPQRMCTVISQ
jgi:hypothetical protein